MNRRRAVPAGRPRVADVAMREPEPGITGERGNAAG
jgi:hypothetical protein